jgi:O-antigen ligase
MREIQGKEKLALTIALLASCTTLAIAPIYAYDAFTTFKLFFIYSLGGVSIFFILRNVKGLRPKFGNLTGLVLLFLFVDMVIILFVSDIDKTQIFYGVGGRYTGFGTYFAFTLILVAAALVSNFYARKRVLSAFLICGILTVVYSLFQYSGNDFVKWDGNAESKVVGFVGNPNFVSIFLALTATLAFAKILGEFKVSLINGCYFLIIIGSIIGLFGANSTQGFLILGIGFAIVLYFFVKFRFQSKVPSRFVATGSLAGIVIGALDIFQKVPWDPFLYGETVSIRGDYWQAGWNTALSHPIFGVGFDGYLNFNRRSRDLDASLRPGKDVPTDAAHNVFLDFAASGGFVFLLLNLALIALILISASRYLKQTQVYEPIYVAIFALWVGLMIQSIVSINQLGLAIWSWVFGGLILGSKFDVQDLGQIIKKNIRKKSLRIDTYGATIATAGLLGGMIALPIVIADHNFKKAIDSRSALELYNAANSWPPITKKMVLVTAVLNENKIYKEAQMLSKRTLEINPDSFEAWIIYAHNPILSESELVEIKKQLLRLDPNINKLGGINKYLAEKLAQKDPTL